MTRQWFDLSRKFSCTEDVNNMLRSSQPIMKQPLAWCSSARFRSCNRETLYFFRPRPCKRGFQYIPCTSHNRTPCSHSDSAAANSGCFDVLRLHHPIVSLLQCAYIGNLLTSSLARRFPDLCRCSVKQEAIASGWRQRTCSRVLQSVEGSLHRSYCETR